MGAETDARSDDRLATALERLTGIQKSIQNLHQEAARIRRHIKDFDVDVDALNLLVTVRSKEETNDGGKLLEHMISYARRTGMPMGVYENEGIARMSDRPAPVDRSPPAAEEGVEPGGERRPAGRLQWVAQILVAAAVTTGLFVLIH